MTKRSDSEDALIEIERLAKQINVAEQKLAQDQDTLEDWLWQANAGGASVSHLSRLIGRRRESTHYAILRAKARGNG